VVDLVVVESALAITLRNPGGAQPILLALHLLALAGTRNPEAGGRYFFD
jgi:hypothetical protein